MAEMDGNGSGMEWGHTLERTVGVVFFELDANVLTLMAYV